MSRPLEKAKRWVKDVAVRATIIFLGFAPVACHYELTAPILWNHGSSYAFEAWLLGWIISAAIACGSLWLSWLD